MTANNNRHLYRSREECIIAGVCGGLADYFGLDVSKLRVALLIMILLGGLSIWVYIILWLVVPQNPKG
ncbi:PspC domain-containing protein [uncultured Alistipes sp.]|uniref:PspC domain-containing protein n=1 Tax=uncultured Alistipes sp. TaxID=538949 RepID=UPI00320836C5